MEREIIFSIELLTNKWVKNMNKYRSSMDFIFCELFTNYKYHCFRYYNDCGLQLNKLLNVKQIKTFDIQILMALKFAFYLYNDELKVSWGWFKRQVLAIAI